jgi:phenylpropionate dioxygenase-like ring-hydroxylating dioxygenase large terminal subunit
MPYLMNAWYCAGWSDDLDPGEKKAITILGRSLVLFRSIAGQVVAFDNRCPHRFAPLDRGTVVEKGLMCGYHGLVFDSAGACVHNPHGKGMIPPSARVKSYPLEERFGAIWAWMGDQPADLSKLTEFEGFEPETNYLGRGYILASANYQLESDNILDLSHLQYLHATTLGSDEISNARLEAEQEGNTVFSRRYVKSEEPQPFLREAFFVPDQVARVDRTQEVRWDAPANLLLRVWVMPAGRPESEGHLRIFCHFFTPETETSTHYFYSIAYPRSMGPEAAVLVEKGVAALATPFQLEDLPMLEAQQRVIGERDLMDLRPVLLESDGGSVRARRVLARLIKQEQEALRQDAKVTRPTKAAV